MNYHDLLARLQNIDVDFNPERDARSTFGGFSIDFTIRSRDDWPSKYDLPRENSDGFPSLITRSSITVEGTHRDEGMDALRLALDDDYEEITEDDVDLYVDEMVLHLPPYTKEQKELVEEYIPTEDEPMDWVFGQRIGFGPVEPEWGVTPHLYLHDDETISPEKAVQKVRQCINLVENEMPMTSHQVAKAKGMIEDA